MFRRHRNFRRLGITQNKKYNIHNMANVGYQGQIFLLQKKNSNSAVIKFLCVSILMKTLNILSQYKVSSNNNYKYKYSFIIIQPASLLYILKRPIKKFTLFTNLIEIKFTLSVIKTTASHCGIYIL